MALFRAFSRAFASSNARPSTAISNGLAPFSPRLTGPSSALGIYYYYAPPTLVLLSYFSTTKTALYAEEESSSAAAAAAKLKSKSSTLFREASPAALRRPVTNLVFLRMQDDADERRGHESWVGYFREAGFDCIEMNLDLAAGDAQGSTAAIDEEAWSKELEGQLRLLSLQRAPLLFCRGSASADAAALHIKSKSARASGLVVVVPSDEKREEVQARLAGLQINPKHNRVLVIVEPQGKDDSAIKDVERWITNEGLA